MLARLPACARSQRERERERERAVGDYKKIDFCCDLAECRLHATFLRTQKCRIAPLKLLQTDSLVSSFSPPLALDLQVGNGHSEKATCF